MRIQWVLFLTFLSVLGHAQNNSDSAEALASIKSPKVYAENGRMGLQKNTRKIITPPIYDTLYLVSEDLYVGKRFSSSKQQALWGAINSSGEAVLPFNYHTLRYRDGLFIIGYSENNLIKYGVRDKTGTEIVLPRYSHIKIETGLIKAKDNSGSILFSSTGLKLAEYKADSIELLNNELVKVFDNGKAGLSNLNNQEVVPILFEDIKLTDNSIYGKQYPKWNYVKGFDTLTFHASDLAEWGENFILKLGNKAQVVNNRKEVISASYNNILEVSSTLAIVKDNSQWGAINNFGKEIIDLSFEEIKSDNEVIAVRSFGFNGKWSIYDHYGYPKTKLKYDAVGTMENGRLPIKRNGKWGYLDRFGIEIITPIYDSVGVFKDGKAVVDFFGQSGLIDKSGKWVVAPLRHEIIGFTNDILLEKTNGQYQVKSYANELIYFTNNILTITGEGFDEVDSTGQVVRKISWTGTILSDIYTGQSLMAGGSGLVIFKENGRYGFKDHENRIRIANRYEAVKPFHQGLAAVKINNNWGFINLDEIIIVQPKYDSVDYFIGGTCITSLNGQLGLIDMSGHEIIKNRYTNIVRLSDGKFRVNENGTWGVLDEAGAVIIHPRYSTLTDTNQGFYIVERNGKYGTIDTSGISKIPVLYDFIGYNSSRKTLVTKKAYNEEWAFIKKAHSTSQ